MIRKIFFCALICGAPSLIAQERALHCNANRDPASYCEMRETTLPPSGSLDIDGGVNGGVSIKAWNHGEILVRSRVNASGENDSDARRLVSQIRVVTSGGRIRAEGPAEEHRGWGVDFEIFVPSRIDIAVRTHNGGIHLAGVEGRIRFSAVNGGIDLSRLGGDVEGSTTNGGLLVELGGNRWSGARCDISTTNGGVKILVPSGYSAHLETRTQNGGMHIGYPMTVHGRLSGGQLSVDLGSGGALVRAVTTNGGVSIEMS